MEFSFLFAIICAVLAHSRGRSAIGWFILGLIFMFLPLIALVILPDLNEEKARTERMRGDADRLDEKVRQERQRREAFEDHTLARLDAHDRNAGIDTRAAAPPPLPATPVARELEAEIWFYEDAGASRGPITESELRRKLDGGEIPRGTLVWCEGMTDWTPARRVSSLA